MHDNNTPLPFSFFVPLLLFLALQSPTIINAQEREAIEDTIETLLGDRLSYEELVSGDMFLTLDQFIKIRCQNLLMILA